MKRVVALSTDKASSPINLYGATKLTADKLFITGNHYAAAYDTRFSVVRYGNVMGSRGSVIPFFRRLAEAGRVAADHRPALHPVLHHAAAGGAVRRRLLRPDGRRRALRPADPVDEDHRPGRRRSRPARRCTTSGLRPGEKLHEEMISPEEGRRALRLEDRYVVQPDLGYLGLACRRPDGVPVEDGFFYRSDSNDQWYTREQIAQIVASGI